MNRFGCRRFSGDFRDPGAAAAITIAVCNCVCACVFFFPESIATTFYRFGARYIFGGFYFLILFFFFLFCFSRAFERPQPESPIALTPYNNWLSDLHPPRPPTRRRQVGCGPRDTCTTVIRADFVPFHSGQRVSRITIYIAYGGCGNAHEDFTGY